MTLPALSRKSTGRNRFSEKQNQILKSTEHRQYEKFK